MNDQVGMKLVVQDRAQPGPAARLGVGVVAGHESGDADGPVGLDRLSAAHPRPGWPGQSPRAPEIKILSRLIETGARGLCPIACRLRAEGVGVAAIEGSEPGSYPRVCRPFGVETLRAVHP